MSTRQFTLEVPSDFSPRVGSFFAQLEDVRQRTKRYVEGLTKEQLAWHPNPKAESIGTLLLHIAAVEYSYIQEDIAGKEMGPEWLPAFAIRFDQPQVTDRELSYFMEKLDDVRLATRTLLRVLTDNDLMKIISPPDPEDKTQKIEYSIEWILYHLVEHEAHHKGQIAIMKRLLPE